MFSLDKKHFCINTIKIELVAPRCPEITLWHLKGTFEFKMINTNWGCLLGYNQTPFHLRSAGATLFVSAFLAAPISVHDEKCKRWDAYFFLTSMLKLAVVTGYNCPDVSYYAYCSMQILACRRGLAKKILTGAV